MTKNINNNEIETVEGICTENTTAQEQNYTQPTKPKRNFLKPLIIGTLAVLMTGGVGAYAYDKYEQNQRAKIQEAYSNVKMNVGTNNDNNQNNNTSSDVNNNNSSAATNNVTTNSNNQQTEPQQTQNIKSQDEIRNIVSSAISTPVANITFTKVIPEYEDGYAYQNNGQPLYIYDVEARANGLEYDIQIDAATGKVLKVEIDN